MVMRPNSYGICLKTFPERYLNIFSFRYEKHKFYHFL